MQKCEWLGMFSLRQTMCDSLFFDLTYVVFSLEDEVQFSFVSIVDITSIYTTGVYVMCFVKNSFWGEEPSSILLEMLRICRFMFNYREFHETFRTIILTAMATLRHSREGRLHSLFFFPPPPRRIKERKVLPMKIRFCIISWKLRVGDRSIVSTRNNRSLA